MPGRDPYLPPGLMHSVGSGHSQRKEKDLRVFIVDCTCSRNAMDQYVPETKQPG